MKNQKITITFCLALLSLILIIASAKLFNFATSDGLLGGLFSLPAVRAAENKAVYAAQLISAEPAGTISVNKGEELTVSLKFKNTGTVTWQRDIFNFTAIATDQPLMRLSQFKQSSWEEAFRPARISEKTVKPGGIGTFTFKIKAPQKTGSFSESFVLVVRRVAWIDNSAITLKFQVKEKNAAQDREAATKPGSTAKSPVVTEKEAFHTPTAQQIANLKNDMEAANKNRVILLSDSQSSPAISDLKESEINTTDAINPSKATQALVNIGPTIRVGLFATSTPQIVTANQQYTVKLGNGVILGQIKANQLATLSYNNSTGEYQITADNLNYKDTSWLILEGQSVDTVFEVLSFDNRLPWAPSINDHYFRNKLELRYSTGTGKTWLINELPMEYYIKGVAEVTNASPHEYLKAMAVAIRTYTYYHYNKGVVNNIADGSGKHSSEHYHVDSVYDQVYRGYNSEVRLTNFIQAVDETQGQIVTYESKVAITPYFSRSDGRTRSFKEVWYSDVPWLISVATPYTANNTLYGHGVGMDCTDAYRRADKEGIAYDNILKYYYTGVSLYKQY